MKKIIIILLLIIFCPLTGLYQGSQLFAQNWSNEQSKSLWDLADETGEYYYQRCDSCNRVIDGKSKKELEYNIKRHISSFHFKYPENNKTSTYKPEESEESGESEGIEEAGGKVDSSTEDKSISVIDIYEAADILQHVLTDNKYNIIEKFEKKHSFIQDTYVSLDDFINFIQVVYKAKRIEYISNRYKTIYLYKNGILLRNSVMSYLNYKVTDIKTYNYDYIFEFY